MFKNKSLLLSLLAITTFISCAAPAPRLSQFAYGSASVLPVIIYNNDIYVILAREAFGSARGTYDDFGGSREKANVRKGIAEERHPVVTAAREFFEEGNLQKTIGLNVQQVQDFIDISKSNNTLYIVAYSQGRIKCAIYVTNFEKYKTRFFNNFYPARRHTTASHFLEKDRIAIVKWQVLKKTFTTKRSNQNVTVEALVLDPRTQAWNKTTIPLRAFFVKKLRPFFLDKPYQQGAHRKIRFYNE